METCTCDFDWASIATDSLDNSVGIVMWKPGNLSWACTGNPKIYLNGEFESIIRQYVVGGTNVPFSTEWFLDFNRNNSMGLEFCVPFAFGLLLPQKEAIN